MTKTTKKIKIYSSPNCANCQAAKDFFQENSFDYEEINAATNPEARKYIMERTGQIGVPVIEIDDKAWVGFNRDIIEEELNS
jgi:Glutaredoxin and related proteins